MIPERRIRALHLTAPEERWIGRGAFLVEDALRTASLPWADGGRLLLVRAVNLGTIPTGAAPASVALALERRLREVAMSAVHATEPAAPQAAAVWFRDAAEAHALLAVRLARGEEPTTWFWRLAVPAWTPGTPRSAALRDLLLGALETPAGPAAALELVRALWEEGGLDLLASALAPDDGPRLLQAFGWRMPGPGVALAAVRGAGALLLARWAGAWGSADPRTAWLAAVLRVVARDANAGSDAPAFGRGEVLRMPAVGPHPPAPSPIAPPSAGRGGDLSREILAQEDLTRAEEERESELAEKGGSFPLSRRKGGRWERGSGGEVSKAATTTEAQPEPTPLPPHRRDAPWGVSETATPFQAPQEVPGRHPVSSDAPSGGGPSNRSSDGTAAPDPAADSNGAVAVPAPAIPPRVETRGYEWPSLQDGGVSQQTPSVQQGQPLSSPGFQPGVGRRPVVGAGRQPEVAHRPGAHQPDAEAAAPARPIGPVSDPSVVAAAETPHGASLQWGRDHREMEVGMEEAEAAPMADPEWGPMPPLPLPLPSGETSPHAGLLFLLPVLDRVGLPAFLEEHPHLLEANFSARFLDHMARRLGAAADDPIRRALLLSGDEEIEGEEAFFTTWRIAVRRWCRLRAGIGLADLIRRPGRVIATRTHVDVFFDPREVEIRVRRAGLDLDPGWVSWLGRVVLFHYEQPPEVFDAG